MGGGIFFCSVRPLESGFEWVRSKRRGWGESAACRGGWKTGFGAAGPAGKTTVVAPLLALMLADGQGLVMEVVPSPLLEFSRSILRKIFSSVMRKRILAPRGQPQ